MANPSASIEGRLLAASNWAYSIDGAAATVPASPEDYEGFAGMPAAVTSFSGGVNEIDAVLVGTNADGVIVAFRGTLPPDPPPPDPVPTVRDWVQDFECEPIHVGWAMGQVHKGFAAALETLWPAVCQRAAELLKTHATGRLYVTGHSKGGSMAYLAAARFVDAGVITAASLCVRSFEAAHPGDRTFAEWFAARKIDTARYEYGNDIVPHLAPSVAVRGLLGHAEAFRGCLQSVGVLWDYVSPGELRYVDQGLAVRAENPESFDTRMERLNNLGQCIFAGQAKELVADHAIRKGSALWSALA
jgi:hypothetical protein